MNVSKSIAPILLAGSTLVAGCSWTGSVFNDKVDYQAARTRTVPLEIPPDLSQLPRDERFTVPLFQRPYVWTKEEQWEPLWDDLLGALRRLEARKGDAPVASHFLGTNRGSSRCAGRRTGERSGGHGRADRCARQD